jgi:hypothetical protein
LPPLRETEREAGGRAPDGEPSRTPSTKAYRHILDFQKIAVLYLVSRKMVHSDMVATIASPMAWRKPTAVDPRSAIRGHVRQLHFIYTILIHMIRDGRKKERMA